MLHRCQQSVYAHGLLRKATHFQKVGLKTMAAAETGESHRLSETLVAQQMSAA